MKTSLRGVQNTSLWRWLSGAGSASLDLLFPPGCFACGETNEELKKEHHGVCAACFQELALLGPECCLKCAAPAAMIGGQPAEGCGRCREEPLRFDGAIAAGAYEGLLRKLVLRTKRAAGDATATALGRLMWRCSRARLLQESPDLVTTTPMHWRRRLARQTNAPDLMGEVIARSLGIPLRIGLLRRTRATRPQTQLSRSQRAPNVRAAFSLPRGRRLEGARIVLIDDILTTGATCSEAARTLKKAGAERVVVVVAARSF